MQTPSDGPSFDHAVQNTKRPGDEEQVMGEYFPQVKYFADAAAVDALGCGGLPKDFN